MTTEEDFQRKLDDDVSDWQTRLVFADWLEEQDDIRATGYRWMGRERHHPSSCSDGFTWFNAAYGFHTADGSTIKADVFAKLKGGEQLFAGELDEDIEAPNKWRDFPTRKEAEDAAALAFVSLPEGKR